MCAGEWARVRTVGNAVDPERARGRERSFVFGIDRAKFEVAQCAYFLDSWGAWVRRLADRKLRIVY